VNRALAAGLPAVWIAVAMVILQGGVQASLLDVTQRILPLAVLAGGLAAWRADCLRVTAALGVVVALALVPPYARNFWDATQTVLAVAAVILGVTLMGGSERVLAPWSLVLTCAAAAALVFDSGSFVFATQLAAVGGALAVALFLPSIRPRLVAAAAPLLAALLVAAWLYGGLSNDRLVALAALPWLATLASRLT